MRGGKSRASFLISRTKEDQDSEAASHVQFASTALGMARLGADIRHLLLTEQTARYLIQVADAASSPALHRGVNSPVRFVLEISRQSTIVGPACSQHRMNLKQIADAGKTEELLEVYCMAKAGCQHTHLNILLTLQQDQARLEDV